MHLKRNMCRRLQDNQITMGFVAFLGSSPNSSTWFIVTFCTGRWEGNVFYLTTHSTHFNLRLYGIGHIQIVREETCCRHIGYSFRLTARVLLYAPSHRQDSTYHGLCYTSCGVLAGMRNSSMGPPHKGSIRRPIAP